MISYPAQKLGIAEKKYYIKDIITSNNKEWSIIINRCVFEVSETLLQCIYQTDNNIIGLVFLFDFTEFFNHFEGYFEI